jgi:hypothetical protein
MRRRFLFVDRKVAPRVPITARLVADLITTAGAHRVLGTQAPLPLSALTTNGNTFHALTARFMFLTLRRRRYIVAVDFCSIRAARRSNSRVL